MVVPSAALSGVSDVAISYPGAMTGSCVFALKQDGTLVAWDTSSGTTVQLPTDLQSGIVSVTMGSFGRILVLKSSGAVVSASISSSGTSPISYSFIIETVPIDARSGVAKILNSSFGSLYVYAIKENGELIRWDQNGILRTVPSLASSDVIDAGGEADEGIALLRSAGLVVCYLEKCLGSQSRCRHRQNEKNSRLS
jgi:hypothetical protein